LLKPTLLKQSIDSMQSLLKSEWHFHRNWKNVLKFTWNHKRATNSQINNLIKNGEESEWIFLHRQSTNKWKGAQHQ
jgi:hypothetical protein